jgi:uncharacterized membrane protein
MNWKLILLLSVFGVVMGVISLFGWTQGIEPLLWLAIFILYAWWIARNCERLYFLHGLLVSVLNGIWISIIHAAFYSLYVKNNPQVVGAFKSLPPTLDPRVLMLIIGPIVGAITGLVAGLFAYIAARILKKSKQAEA